MKWAIASHYSAGRRYWTGKSDFTSGEQFEPIIAAEPDSARQWDRYEDARAAAVALTESCHDLPPFDARTWFAIALAGSRR